MKKYTLIAIVFTFLLSGQFVSAQSYNFQMPTFTMPDLNFDMPNINIDMPKIDLPTSVDIPNINIDVSAMTQSIQSAAEKAVSQAGEATSKITPPVKVVKPLPVRRTWWSRFFSFWRR
jgi:hypothetical protein